ncbi:hypothetical protein G15_0284 [Enterococcus avium]|nr:hypothetical protein G15_0284 [Enterococcus avium]
MLKKISFIGLAILSVVFLIVSVVSWNLYLGACALIIACSLTRFLETGSYIRVSRKEIRSDKSA